MKKRVVILKKEDYRNLDTQIEKVFELSGYKPQHKTILLKPNIVDGYTPSSGAITHPKLVEALVVYFKKHYPQSKILVGEGPAVQSDLNLILKRTGYYRLIKKYNLELINFDFVKREKIKWKYGALELPTLLKDYEIINVPKLKTHMQTGISVSMKNLKGFLAKRQKKLFHNLDLNKCILELNKVIKPDFNIVDGILGLEGNGPSNFGKPIRSKVIIAGYSTIYVDNICCKIMGVNSSKIRYLPTIKKIQSLGEVINNVKVKFREPDKLFHVLKLNLYLNQSCSMCQIQTQKAITRMIKNPLYWPKLLMNGILHRKDIILGKNAKFNNNYTNLTCIGNCTKKFCEKFHQTYISGCPPTVDEIIKKL